MIQANTRLAIINPACSFCCGLLFSPTYAAIPFEPCRIEV
jgi:hypothetical protein